MYSGSMADNVYRRWRTRGTLIVASCATMALLLGVLGGTLASTVPAADAATLPAATQFVYTGGEQSYTVPPGVTLLTVDAIGAFGGPALYQGGDGENLIAYLPVTPGETLYTEVGQTGSTGGGASFGGGGAAGAANGNSGGGATDIRTCSELASTCPGGGTSAASRLIVAGGGGGEGGTSPAGYDACGGGDYAGGANAGGPAHIVTTSAGSFILAQPANSTFLPSTPAGGGTDTAAGVAGFTGSCTFSGETYSGSTAGTSGNGPVGGSGGNTTEFGGGGGGGGGGYFAGGGGASGNEICTPTACISGSSGAGGGGGSSFVSPVAAIGSGLSIGGATGSPSVTYTPEVEIDSPTNGATYALGQQVNASFTCDPALLPGCAGTVASGLPFDTSTVGPHTFVVQGTVSSGYQPVTVQGVVTYTVAGTAPSFTSAPSTSFTLGSAGNFSVMTSGAPISALTESTAGGQSGLPAWASLVDNGDGTATLSGTPPPGSGGTYTFTLTATNGVSPAATQSFTLTVNQPPAFTSADVFSFTLNSPGTYAPTATGSPTPIITESGTLPNGVSFTGGTVSGTPTVSGTFPITFTASNGVSPNAAQAFTLTVLGFHITTTSLPDATRGVAYSFQLQAAGGVAPYKFKALASLPKGLKLSSRGFISGAVNAKKVSPGTYTISVEASDSRSKKAGGKEVATQNFTLTAS
jgi:large repetitive protein